MIPFGQSLVHETRIPKVSVKFDPSKWRTLTRRPRSEGEILNLPIAAIVENLFLSDTLYIQIVEMK